MGNLYRNKIDPQIAFFSQKKIAFVDRLHRSRIFLAVDRRTSDSFVRRGQNRFFFSQAGSLHRQITKGSVSYHSDTGQKDRRLLLVC